ncbi:MAG: YlbF family regulator [Planctomycetota bacterium]
MPDDNDAKQIETDAIEAAQKLGDLVAKHPVFEQYAKASKALRDDPEAGRLLQQFEQKAMVLARNEQMGQPVTAAERQELEQMQQTIAGNLRVKAFSIAQADMTDVLRKVSQAWQKPVSKAQGEDDAPTGPGGGMGGVQGSSPISLG